MYLLFIIIGVCLSYKFKYIEQKGILIQSNKPTINNNLNIINRFLINSDKYDTYFQYTDDKSIPDFNIKGFILNTLIKRWYICGSTKYIDWVVRLLHKYDIQIEGLVCDKFIESNKPTLIIPQYLFNDKEVDLAFIYKNNDASCLSFVKNKDGISIVCNEWDTNYKIIIDLPDDICRLFIISKFIDGSLFDYNKFIKSNHVYLIENL
jgi:hypothetical protein